MSPARQRLVVLAGTVAAFAAPSRGRAQAPPAFTCASCAEWNAEQVPFRIFGNSWYVGTHGLAAVLVTSRQGHILIDGGLPESAPLIAAHIRALGFRVQDVKLIVNSHVHFDHAGGIAELQRRSGARVAASPSSAAVLRRGTSGEDDPQFGALPPIAPVTRVRTIADGEVLRVGRLAVTAHFTPGHTPGGTTWTWRSCEGTRCRALVYADSQSPISADGFRFTASRTYPTALDDFARGHTLLEHLRCDILITPHPDASGLWERVARRDAGDADALRAPGACRESAAVARRKLAQRIAEERGPGGFRAWGNEPGWSLELEEGGMTTLVSGYGAVTLQGRTSAPVRDASAVLRYEVATDSGRVRITIEPVMCVDDADQKNPATVSVTYGDTVLRGCGAPAASKSP